jgi:hypothetical protein
MLNPKNPAGRESAEQEQNKAECGSTESHLTAPSLRNEPAGVISPEERERIRQQIDSEIGHNSATVGIMRECLIQTTWQLEQAQKELANQEAVEAHVWRDLATAEASLREAREAASMCDDVSLDQSIANIINQLQDHREFLESEVKRLKGVK